MPPCTLWRDRFPCRIWRTGVWTVFRPCVFYAVLRNATRWIGGRRLFWESVPFRAWRRWRFRCRGMKKPGAWCTLLCPWWSMLFDYLDDHSWFDAIMPSLGVRVGVGRICSICVGKIIVKKMIFDSHVRLCNFWVVSQKILLAVQVQAQPSK